MARKIVDVQIDNSELVSPSTILKMPIDNVIYKTYIKNGSWSKSDLLIIKSLVDKDIKYDFIDIGANVGLVTLFVSKFFNNVEKITCFEPDKELYKCLLNNTKKIKNISLNNFGIDDSEGEKIFYTDSKNHGNNSLYINNEALLHGYEVTKIETKTPELFKERKSKNKIIYKSDTQGNDIRIINSLPNEFWKDVDYCLIEFWNISQDPVGPFLNKLTKFNHFFIGKKEVSYNELSKKLLKTGPNKQLNITCGI